MEAEAELGPIGTGLLTLETLQEFTLRAYPTVVLSGSHGGAGQLSSDSVLGVRRTMLAAGARSVPRTAG